MMLNSITRRVSVVAAFALIPAALVAKPNSDALALEREGVDLIREVEEIARDVRSHASRLDQFSRSPLISKPTHAYHLSQIRTLINENLRPVMMRLGEIQPQLPEWKQQAIDQMIAAARLLAEDATDAIIAKREAKTLPTSMNADYKDLVSRVHAHAEKLVKTSDAAGNYAAARLKAHSAGVPVAVN